MCRLEPVQNRKRLGASPNTNPALSAIGGPVLFVPVNAAACFDIAVLNCIVVNFKDSRHIDAFGTRHASAAGRATDRIQLLVCLANVAQEHQFLNREAVGLGAIGHFNILRCVPQRVDVAYDGRDLRQVPDKAQAPLGQAALLPGTSPDLSYRFGRLGREPSAPQRFGNNHGQPLVRGILDAADAGVVIDIHITELKLAQGPVIVSGNYGSERLIMIVEGKAQPAHPAIAHGPFRPT